MPKIIQLDRHVADLIAAGEVVERPASAVKELVENSIDAGAKNITIELQNGGMTFLRITDDGCGMDPVDARTAFLRHATSKIRKKEDLACIGTLGFRGEALAAISSVSKIDLLTTPDKKCGRYAIVVALLRNTPFSRNSLIISAKIILIGVVQSILNTFSKSVLRMSRQQFL